MDKALRGLAQLAVGLGFAATALQTSMYNGTEDPFNSSLTRFSVEPSSSSGGRAPGHHL